MEVGLFSVYPLPVIGQMDKGKAKRYGCAPRTRSSFCEKGATVLTRPRFTPSIYPNEEAAIDPDPLKRRK